MNGFAAGVGASDIKRIVLLAAVSSLVGCAIGFTAALVLVNWFRLFGCVP